MQVQDIQSVIEKFFEENELEDCFFVNSRVSGNKIEAFIDRDGGISFDICRRVSRHLEAIFDETQVFGEKYTLDVSSPGIGASLTMPRQYKNNLGRKIEVKVKEGETTKGTLKEVTENGIVIEVEYTVKLGKKKVKEIKLIDINYGDMMEAKIKVSFK